MIRRKYINRFLALGALVCGLAMGGLQGVKVEVQAAAIGTDQKIEEIFADANLAAAVAAKLNKAVDETVSQSDLDGITFLGIDNCSISQLDGMEYLNNIMMLSAGTNNISDLSPLANLTRLGELYLNNNNISDPNPLANLTNLSRLALNRNNISDLSPLANLTDLMDLNVSTNNISDLSPLANLTNLAELYLSNNNISDLSPLANLTHLSILELNNNCISDFSVLDNANISFTGRDTQRLAPEAPSKTAASHLQKPAESEPEPEILLVNEVTYQNGAVSKHTLQGIYNSAIVCGCVITTPLADLEAAAGLTAEMKKEGAVLKYYVCDSRSSKTRTLLAQTAAQDGYQLSGVINADLYLLTQGTVIPVRTVNTPVRLVAGIPARLQKEGRSFTLLCFDSQGNKVVLKDTDSDNTTITVDTTVFGLFAVCWQDSNQNQNR